MVISGRSRGGRGLAAHLLNADTNERIEVIELRGVAARGLREAIAEMAAVRGTSTKPIYHAHISPAPSEASKMTRARWREAVDRLEASLGLEGQPRAVVAHLKHGRPHYHIVWNRTDLATMRPISDGWNYPRHEMVARALERDFGMAPVRGVFGRPESTPRPVATANHGEWQQATRTDLSVAEVRRAVTTAWRSSDNASTFESALEKEGYCLARGDRRDFVVVDPKGGVHSLRRRVEGAKASDIRARMNGFPPTCLPTVAELRARPQPSQQAAMQQSAPQSSSPPAENHAKIGASSSAVVREATSEHRLAINHTRAAIAERTAALTEVGRILGNPPRRPPLGFAHHAKSQIGGAHYARAKRQLHEVREQRRAGSWITKLLLLPRLYVANTRLHAAEAWLAQSEQQRRAATLAARSERAYQERMRAYAHAQQDHQRLADELHSLRAHQYFVDPEYRFSVQLQRTEKALREFDASGWPGPVEPILRDARADGVLDTLRDHLTSRQKLALERAIRLIEVAQSPAAQSPAHHPAPQPR